MYLQSKVNGYKICQKCIMDTTDPGIQFNAQGVCVYCQNFENRILPRWGLAASNNDELEILARKIRSEGKGKEFDCIIGLSGGLDSSYVVYIATKVMGLRPLVFHVDAGWNTDQAVGNIEKIVDGLRLDLFTEVINWESVKRMQVAFLRSGIPDQDLVQDAAFFSGLYRYARQYKIKNIITGSNYSTECCREPEEWGGYIGIDSTLFSSVWSKCGDGMPNDEFPIVDIFKYKIWYQKVLGMRVHHPLNLVPYRKAEAEKLLGEQFGWKSFQHKHHESRFTRFYEDYWLPKRFGFEKRRAHFSSLIMTGQMNRNDAIQRISRPEMDDLFLNQEFDYIADKLDLTRGQLLELFALPIKSFHDYRNKRMLISIGTVLMRMLGLERRYFG
jgi:N-acetyl sugar amidotransferase